MVFVCSSSSAHHHQLIIISSAHHHFIIISSSSSSSSSSSHHHHHLTIIIIIIFPSLSLAFLFFSILAQPSSHEKRARCNPSQGKCVFRTKKCQKLRVFCDFNFFGATLCGNPAVECQKLRVFCEFFFGPVHPSQGKRGSSVKNWFFFAFLVCPKVS